MDKPLILAPTANNSHAALAPTAIRSLGGANATQARYARKVGANATGANAKGLVIILSVRFGRDEKKRNFWSISISASLLGRSPAKDPSKDSLPTTLLL